MANTYTQLYIHIVFAVKRYKPLIQDQSRERIEKYIYGIAVNLKCRPLAIYCNPDHIHIFTGIHPSVSIASLVRDIKAYSTRFINENRLVMGRFEWQHGYGAFTYNQSMVERVCNYIQNQHEHHKKRSFKEEYLELLKAFNVQYDDKYVFDEVK